VREYKKEQEKCLIRGNFLPKLQKMGIMMARLPRRSGVEISLNIVKGLGHGTNIFLRAS
jgi:hypothetical protein